MSGPISAELVRELCRRALAGRGELDEPAAAAIERAGGGRLEGLAAALSECRRRGEDGPATARSGPAQAAVTLADAVASELWMANAALPGRQREALALRELLGLSHEEISQAIGIDFAAAGALLARARLALRSELRGAVNDPGDECPERDRALRALARRQDGEALEPGEADWIRGHLAACPACERAHAAMLEASVCYRGWEPGR